MNNNAINQIKQLLNIIIDEMKSNDEFAVKVESVFNSGSSDMKKEFGQAMAKEKKHNESRRASNRRDPAVIDPISLIEESEQVLLEKLQNLNEKQLKDIIADYNMDPAKLAMKWKNKQKLIEKIIEVSRTRATKGDVFRSLQ